MWNSIGSFGNDLLCGRSFDEVFVKGEGNFPLFCCRESIVKCCVPNGQNSSCIRRLTGAH